MAGNKRKTAQTIEQAKSLIATAGKRKNKPRGKPFEKGNKLGNRFKPGESGNPTGKPGTDLAALAARRVFEESPGELPDIPKGFNAYAFSVLADRGYGKMTDKVAVNLGGELIDRLLAGRKRARGK